MLAISHGVSSRSGVNKRENVYDNEEKSQLDGCGHSLCAFECVYVRQEDRQWMYG